MNYETIAYWSEEKQQMVYEKFEFNQADLNQIGIFSSIRSARENKKNSEPESSENYLNPHAEQFLKKIVSSNL